MLLMQMGEEHRVRLRERSGGKPGRVVTSAA